MLEYFVYFPFFILRDWGKRSAEARSSHCAVLPKDLPCLDIWLRDSIMNIYKK